MKVPFLPVLLLAAGAAVLGYFLAVLCRGLFSVLPAFSLGDYFRRRRREKLSESLRQIDLLIAAGNYREAERVLFQSFILSSPPPADYSADLISQHNFLALEKAVDLLEAVDAHYRDLDMIEKAFHERASLVKLYFDSAATKRKLKTKAPVPAWAEEELDRKLAKILVEMSENENFLTKELKSLLACTRESSGPPELKYH